MRLLLAAIVLSLAACGGKGPVIVEVKPTPVPTPVPCPLYYPCEITDYPNPQFATGADPLCYNSSPCPTTQVAASLPIPDLNALAARAWAAMQEMNLPDLRTSEQVPIRWKNPPTISVCWSSFRVQNPVCMGDVHDICTGKVSWVTAKPYEPATYRVAIRTDVDADTQRVLVVDGTVNLALMFLNHTDQYNGQIGAAVKARLLGK